MSHNCNCNGNHHGEEEEKHEKLEKILYIISVIIFAITFIPQIPENIKIGIKEENKRFLYELSMIKEIKENKEMFAYLKNIRKDINKQVV